MPEIHLERVIATHLHEWRKWPDTPDTDFDPILKLRALHRYVHKPSDTTFVVTSRYWPVYMAHVAAGISGPELAPQHARVTDNTKPPPPALIAEQRVELDALAREVAVLTWDHAIACSPQTAAYMKGRFKVSTLYFADDAPGSSELKSFPVASCFDSVMHFMDVWSFKTGERTATKYWRHGVPFVRFALSNPSAGLENWIADSGFSIEDKAESIAQGEPLTDLVFAGFSGNAWRNELVDAIDRASLSWRESGISVRLHGPTGRDGWLPMDHPRGFSYPLGPIYQDALFGFNGPVSSIFNTRLLDYALMGIVPIMQDRWGELRDHGILPGHDYLPFDGTLAGIEGVLRTWRPRRYELAAMVLRAHARMEALRRRENVDAGYAAIYHHFRDRLPA